jgi:hypothetical protein
MRWGLGLTACVVLVAVFGPAVIEGTDGACRAYVLRHAAEDRRYGVAGPGAALDAAINYQFVAPGLDPVRCTLAYWNDFLTPRVGRVKGP